MRANKSPGFLESEAHESVLINCNLMIFNEIDINWMLFELPLIPIALYFNPRNYPHESRKNHIEKIKKRKEKRKK